MHWIVVTSILLHHVVHNYRLNGPGPAECAKRLNKIKAHRPGNKTPGRFDDAESDFEVENAAGKVPDVKKMEKLTPNQ